MERICRQKTGLFPAPTEIRFSCSCPDWASMCKHVAAVFYGIGARLDLQPELLFQLRRVDEKDLVAKAARGLPLSKKGPAGDKVLADADLSELFGLEMGATGEEQAVDGTRTPVKRARAQRKSKTVRATEDGVPPVKSRGGGPSATSRKKPSKG